MLSSQETTPNISQCPWLNQDALNLPPDCWACLWPYSPHCTERSVRELMERKTLPSPPLHSCSEPSSNTRLTKEKAERPHRVLRSRGISRLDGLAKRQWGSETGRTATVFHRHRPARLCFDGCSSTVRDLQWNPQRLSAFSQSTVFND